MLSLPVLIGLALGACVGGLVAWRRGGNAADIAQYAAVFALIGLMLGTGVSIALPAPG